MNIKYEKREKFLEFGIGGTFWFVNIGRLNFVWFFFSGTDEMLKGNFEGLFS